MKKILLLLLLVVFALTANAQRNYEIESQLKLKTVNQGTASDSVLVRGEDKVVKFIPRSEFSSGGGSQDIQNVLEVGSTSSIPITIEGANSRSAVLSHDKLRLNNGTTSYSHLTRGELRFEDQFTYSTTYGRAGIVGGNQGNNGQTILYLNDRTTSGMASYSFGNRVGGVHIIATLDDIPSYSVPNLGQVITTGNDVYGQQFRLNTDETGEYKTVYQAEGVNVFSPDRSSSYGLTAMNLVDSNFIQSFELSDIKFEDRITHKIGHLNFNDTVINDVVLKLPFSKPDGTYTLATLDDIPTIGTTPPASSTDTGVLGETRVTSTYVYHCIAPNTWVREAVEASF